MKKVIRNILDRIRGDESLQKLKRKGLEVGSNFNRQGNVIIDSSHCFHISIGNNVTLAPRVHILAHDASTKMFLGYTKVGNVKIGNNVFIGAGSIVLPGVNIGDNVIIGSGSVVTKDISNNSLAVGVPAKIICSLDTYIKKEEKHMNKKNTFSEKYTIRNPKFNTKNKQELINACEAYGKIYLK